MSEFQTANQGHQIFLHCCVDVTPNSSVQQWRRVERLQELVDMQFLAQAWRGLCVKMRRMMSAEISHAAIASFKDCRIFLGCIIMSKCITGTMCEIGIRSGKGIFRHRDTSN